MGKEVLVEVPERRDRCFPIRARRFDLRWRGQSLARQLALHLITPDLERNTEGEILRRGGARASLQVLQDTTLLFYWHFFPVFRAVLRHFGVLEGRDLGSGGPAARHQILKWTLSVWGLIE